jgi:hypothetical protein
MNDDLFNGKYKIVTRDELKDCDADGTHKSVLCVMNEGETME